MAAGARAESPASFVETLRARAAAEPDGAFRADERTPAAFLELLESRGYPERAPTNAQALALFQAPKDAGDAPGRGPSEIKDRIEALAAVPQGKPASELFDGAAPPKRPEPYGLDFLGIELGLGEEGSRDRAEPYVPKGLDSALDWRVRARAALDGLGGSAHYRHPRSLRSVSATFIKYFDVFDAAGLGAARDKAYAALGQTPYKSLGGFEASVYGAVDQYLGGAATFHRKLYAYGERRVDERALSAMAGYSPLGDNAGRRWNFTLLASLSRQALTAAQGGFHLDRDGLGAAAGAAFQYALRGTPLPGPSPARGQGPLVCWDRVKSQLLVSGSAVDSPALRASVELSLRLFRRVEATVGAALLYRPRPEKGNPMEKTLDPGALAGLDFSY